METFHTTASRVSEECLWIKDGKRYICVTYEYFPNTGGMKYAASVLKSEILAEDHIKNHEETTTRRYEIRPVMTYFQGLF